ncbi:MAG: NAD-dependent epimerase/dehydratase family protein [Chloroflexi bacterium]|nr:NAD-dependent epimerase/dehydratase family protein [Chloroflexota bacterium]
MRVFVTGGNGFIGSVVVRRLVQRGDAVRCLLRARSSTRRIDDVPFERVTGDVREITSLREGISGCDAIVHLAGLSAWRDINSASMPDVVVGGTRNVLQAAQVAHHPRVVCISSSVAVNGTSAPVVHIESSPCTLDLAGYIYARAKRDAEAVCRQAALDGLAVSIVNPCEVYGPYDTGMVTAGNLVDFANSWPALVCGGGTSVAYVDDVADGILAALERGRPGERYILGGDNLSIRQLAAMTLDLLGQHKPILKLPNPLIRGLAAAGPRLHIPLPFEPAVIPYATLYWFMDNRKAREELGVHFRPAQDVLRPTLKWLAESGHIASSVDGSQAGDRVASRK